MVKGSNLDVPRRKLRYVFRMALAMAAGAFLFLIIEKVWVLEF